MAAALQSARRVLDLSGHCIARRISASSNLYTTHLPPSHPVALFVMLSAESIGAPNVIFSLAPQIAAVRHSNHYTGRKQRHLSPYHLSVLFDSGGELCVRR